MGCSAGNNGVYICVFEKEINIQKNIFYFVRSLALFSLGQALGKTTSPSG
jgi:hypothetical protein